MEPSKLEALQILAAFAVAVALVCGAILLGQWLYERFIIWQRRRRLHAPVTALRRAQRNGRRW